MATKAPDCWTFPLCHECHREFDQGTSYTREQRRAFADQWTLATIQRLASNGRLAVK